MQQQGCMKQIAHGHMREATGIGVQELLEGDPIYPIRLEALFGWRERWVSSSLGPNCPRFFAPPNCTTTTADTGTEYILRLEVIYPPTIAIDRALDDFLGTPVKKVRPSLDHWGKDDVLGHLRAWSTNIHTHILP